MRQPPLISVVMATYERGATVARAVESIRRQTLADWELIVVDDGSTDDTAEVLARQAAVEPRVRVVRQGNQGRTAARNVGSRLARADWLTFLDSDDETVPDWLELLLGSSGAKQVGVVCCGATLVHHRPDAGVEGQEVVLPHDRGPVYGHLEGLFLTGTFAIRTELFRSVGGYEESLRFSETTDLVHRLLPELARRSLRVETVPMPLLIAHNSRPVPTGAEAADRLHAAEWILRHHGNTYYRADRAAYANYCSIAAVNARRLGRFRLGATWALRAIRAAPWRMVNYLRLGRSLVPDIRRVAGAS